MAFMFYSNLIAFTGSITPENFEILDLVMLIGSAALLCLLARRGHNITRTEGWLMLAVFMLYYGYIIYGALA